MRRRSYVVAEQSDVQIITLGIKLGLRNFVFYSVLVGRAAMYDLMTLYACYLTIISGFRCTLILLSVCRWDALKFDHVLNLASSLLLWY